MDLFFDAFLRERAGDLRRMAAATRGEMGADDLGQEAWLIAMEISKRRGRDLSLSDRDDQETLLAALWVEKVRRGDWHHRKASSIYGDADDEDGYSPIDFLEAPETSDPLALMLMAEETRSELDESYSQAAAYVVAFSNFGNNTVKLCAYLVLTQGGLRYRVAGAVATVHEQPSIFDRIERIPEDFMPLPGKAYCQRVETVAGADQWTWEF